MTVETRYERNDNVLGLSQTVGYQEYFDSVGAGVTVYWACDVAILHADDSETNIGTKVAQVTRSGTASGIQSNTWDVSQQDLEPTDAIRIRVYQRMGTAKAAWVLCATFTTEQLGATQLDSATWTFYYWTACVRIAKPAYTDGTFRWGDSSYDSRIENFTWSVEVPPTEAGILVQVI